IDARAVDSNAADLEAPLEQRQQLHARRDPLDRGKRLVEVESGRIAERHGLGLDREPREERELELAFDRERAAGALLDPARYVALVIVRIDEQGERKRRDDDERGDGRDDGEEYLDRSHWLLPLSAGAAIVARRVE